MTTLLVTGGTGFIGHHTVDVVLRTTDWNIVILDRLSYAGNLNYLTDLPCWEKEHKRVRFIYHDIRSEVNDVTLKLFPVIDYFIHMAAETHVDRSIEDPYPFVMTNVLGTMNMLELAKKLQPRKMIQVSTDEVYGPALDGHLHCEEERLHPSNPYSASKAGGEALAYAYWNTYSVPVLVSNTMNNYGERQNKEKFLPRTVKNILEGNAVTLHCKLQMGVVTDVSSRCWLHAKHHASGLLFLLDKGNPGEHYNIVGELASVEAVAKMVGSILDLPVHPQYEDFHSFRPGHDMHYGLDGTKMSRMGWRPPTDFSSSLAEVVTWMRDHPQWL